MYFLNSLISETLRVKHNLKFFIYLNFIYLNSLVIFTQLHYIYLFIFIKHKWTMKLSKHYSNLLNYISKYLPITNVSSLFSITKCLAFDVRQCTNCYTITQLQSVVYLTNNITL